MGNQRRKVGGHGKTDLHDLHTVWPEYLSRYEAADASLSTYKQKYDIFIKWVAKRNAGGGGRTPLITQ